MRIKTNRQTIFSSIFSIAVFIGLLALASGNVLAQPLAPGNLTATAISSSQINLSWEDNSSDENDFLLFRSLNTNMLNPTIIPLGPNSTFYSDSGLLSNTTYYYKVYACNNSGCAPSGLASAKTQSASGPFSYGVRFDKNTLTFSGQAWGSDLVGWINFSNPALPYEVKAERVNQAPTAANVIIESPREVWCLDTNLGLLDEPYYRIKWDYSDPDGNPQTQAEIQLVRTADGAIATTTLLNQVDSTYLFFDPLGYIALGSYNSGDYLKTNTEYKARVRVRDDLAWSSYTDSVQATTTPAYYYPFVDFSWMPNPTATSVITTFTDNTRNRSAGAAALAGRTWNFENVTQAPGTGETESVVFTRLPAKATLSVSDSNGNACTLEQTVNPGGAPPLKRRFFRERGD